MKCHVQQQSISHSSIFVDALQPFSKHGVYVDIEQGCKKATKMLH